MADDLQAQFLQAKDESVKLSKAPDNETKLLMYALYKQSTEGDYTNGKKPGMMDFVGKVKYEAWKQKEGLSKEAAIMEYVALIEKLKAADA